jgi:hypothetical protein
MKKVTFKFIKNRLCKYNEIRSDHLLKEGNIAPLFGKKRLARQFYGGPGGILRLYSKS